MDQRTKKTNNKRFVRYAEGAEMYSMSLSKFQQLAKDANEDRVKKYNPLQLSVHMESFYS